MPAVIVHCVIVLSLVLYSGVHQQRVHPESLLLEAVKQVKVSDLEDDILELPEEDPATANNQSVTKTFMFRNAPGYLLET